MLCYQDFHRRKFENESTNLFIFVNPNGNKVHKEVCKNMIEVLKLKSYFFQKEIHI